MHDTNGAVVELMQLGRSALHGAEIALDSRSVVERLDWNSVEPEKGERARLECVNADPDSCRCQKNVPVVKGNRRDSPLRIVPLLHDRPSHVLIFLPPRLRVRTVDEDHSAALCAGDDERIARPWCE